MPSIEPSPPEGARPSPRIAVRLLAALGLCLLVFNAYYFFIRRGVGPDYYLKRAFSRPSDTILDDPLYRDYAEEYQRLNAKLSGRKAIVFAGDSITRRGHDGSIESDFLLCGLPLQCARPPVELGFVKLLPQPADRA